MPRRVGGLGGDHEPRRARVVRPSTSPKALARGFLQLQSFEENPCQASQGDCLTDTGCCADARPNARARFSPPLLVPDRVRLVVHSECFTVLTCQSQTLEFVAVSDPESPCGPRIEVDVRCGSEVVGPYLAPRHPSPRGWAEVRRQARHPDSPRPSPARQPTPRATSSLPFHSYIARILPIPTSRCTACHPVSLARPVISPARLRSSSFPARFPGRTPHSPPATTPPVYPARIHPDATPRPTRAS